MRPPAYDEPTACEGIDVDRFEGEHPGRQWPHGRDVQVQIAGYAPSKYRTKQWPDEAQLEAWYSHPWEVLDSFEIDIPPLTSPDGRTPSTPCPQAHRPSRGRDAAPVGRNLERERTARPQGEEGRDRVGFALDAAFPRSGGRTGDVVEGADSAPSVDEGRPRPWDGTLGWDGVPAARLRVIRGIAPSTSFL